MINVRHTQQKGAALLVFFLILFTVSSTVLLAGFNSNSSRLRDNANTQEEMLLAKEALLAYAFSYSDNFDLKGPGRLPCSNLSNIEGDDDPDCAFPVVQNGLGRLPLKDSTVPFIFSNQQSGIDKQFWYVADESFRSSPDVPLNSSTPGTLSIDGEAGYVAVIINPGDELSAQDRLSDNLLALNYLEGGNEGGSTFVTFDTDDPENFNDQVIGITQTELMSLAVIKAAREFKDALDAYYEQNSFQSWRWTGGWDSNTNSYPRTGYIWDIPTWSLDTEDELDGLNTTYNYVPVWFTDNNWNIQQVDYTFNNYSNVSFKFTNCSINFTLEYDSNLSMDQREC